MHNQHYVDVVSLAEVRHTYLFAFKSLRSKIYQVLELHKIDDMAAEHSKPKNDDVALFDDTMMILVRTYVQHILSTLVLLYLLRSTA